MLKRIKWFIYSLFSIYDIQYDTLVFLDGSYVYCATEKKTKQFGLGSSKKKAYNDLMYKLSSNTEVKVLKSDQRICQIIQT